MDLSQPLVDSGHRSTQPMGDCATQLRAPVGDDAFESDKSANRSTSQLCANRPHCIETPMPTWVWWSFKATTRGCYLGWQNPPPMDSAVKYTSAISRDGGSPNVWRDPRPGGFSPLEITTLRRALRRSAACWNNRERLRSQSISPAAGVVR
jgi:hypothetical protein